jgi:hypothetical protein
MLYDPQNFLHSMCLWAANRSTGYISGDTQFGAINPPVPVNYGPQANGTNEPKYNLFMNRASEDVAADPFAVVRVYGGSHERSNPTVTAAVQLATMVTQANAPAGWTLANALYRCFCLDPQEKELRCVSAPGVKLTDNSADGSWMLVSAKVTNAPGQIGTDDRGRLKIVSNFDLAFYKAA